MGQAYCKYVHEYLRQQTRSISIIGTAIAEKIMRVIRCKILVSVSGRNMRFNVLSMDAPLHIHGSIGIPSIVNCGGDSSRRELLQTSLSNPTTHILRSFADQMRLDFEYYQEQRRS